LGRDNEHWQNGDDQPGALNRTMSPLRSKLEQTLGWAVLLALVAGCLIVLRPFVSALLWAVVLSFASWPVYRRLLSLLGNRRTLAALAMTLGMVLILLLPFLIVGLTLADNVKELTAATRHWIASGPPAPPEWLAKVPVLGAQAAEYWRNLAADTAKLWTEAQRFIEPVSSWLLKIGLALGGGLMELALSIFITFFLFRDGGDAAHRLSAAVERIGGERGGHLLTAVPRREGEIIGDECPEDVSQRVGLLKRTVVRVLDSGSESADPLKGGAVDKETGIDVRKMLEETG